MTEFRIQLQPSYILHQRKYRETSLILNVLTEDYGIVPLLAKGVRKAKSRTAGLLQPFTPLIISYTGKSELKTLTQVELMSPAPLLTGISLYCGLYLNELVHSFLHPHDPHPEIFHDYRNCLQQLSVNGVPIEATLRVFELTLLENIGYGLSFDYDYTNEQAIEPDKHYQFDASKGVCEARDGRFTGTTLIALRNKKLENRRVLAEAKTLMRQIIEYHLAGKTLNSRTLFNKPGKSQKTRSNGQTEHYSIGR